MVVILTLSLVLNFMFIIGLFVYFKYLRKFSYVINLFKGLNRDSAIVDEKEATDFFGKVITW